MTDLFDFQAPKRHFAVMGNPVKHSLSPIIHKDFAGQSNIDIEYDRIQVDVGGFDQAVSHFAAHGGAGLNITVPFKVEAWQLCQESGNSLSERAELAGAVNTLKFAEDAVTGDNTDGVGLTRDIQINLEQEIEGKAVLMIGAGGAARGVVGPLLDCRPSRLHIVNRTAHKATALAAQYADSGHHNITGSGMDQVNGDFQIVINASAASLGGELPAVDQKVIGNGCLAYDMMYGSEPTSFMTWALAAGAGRVSDGLGMLVEQAAESFFIWHGVRPKSAPVISALRKR